MKLSSVAVAVIVVVSIFGTIGATALAGVWQTESDKVPRLIADGEFEGTYDPADIRGSYTFGDIESSFAVPAATLGEAYGIPADQAATFRVANLEAAYDGIGDLEIGTDSVRLFVALYVGIPYEPEDTTGLPAKAIGILRSHYAETDMDVDALSGLEDMRVELPALSDALVAEGVEADAASERAVAATTLSETHETSEDDTTIKGRTTFADLLGWGVTQDAIEEVIGGPMPARGTTIRDYASQQGIEFSGWKERLQSLVDSL